MYLKKVKIVNARYEVVYNRANRFKDVKFLCELPGNVIAKATICKVNQEASLLWLPFYRKKIRFTNITTLSPHNQIEILDKVVKELTGLKIEVGFYDNVYYEAEVLQTVFGPHPERYAWPSFCNTSNGTLEVFEYDENRKRKLFPPFDKMLFQKERMEKLIHLNNNHFKFQ